MQSAVLAMKNPSVRLSVCMSVTRWYCVKTTQVTNNIYGVYCSVNCTLNIASLEKNIPS